jgi:hypothetical protein
MGKASDEIEAPSFRGRLVRAEPGISRHNFEIPGSRLRRAPE